MTNPADPPKPIQEGNLQAFFHGTLRNTARQHGLEAGDATLHYLTHLLADYAHSDRVFDQTLDGARIRPLAILYRDALEAPSPREQRLWLRRLGDLALFIGGCFAGRLSRRLTDIDYCIAMGGNAYGYLHQTSHDTARDRALSEIFGELAGNFSRFVELLAATTHNKGRDEQTLVALYKDRLSTGDPGSAQRLQAYRLDSHDLNKIH